MPEPNFSESQLQQAANTAFIRTVVEAHGTWPFAHILSLPDEFLYGWDTAFYLDWLPLPPAQDHAGCNFFVQYKLSNQYVSPGANEWSCWKKEYFRFKIPHSTKDVAGKLVDDYHQWDRLKHLANRKYPTYYATNATLSKTTLMSSLEIGTLLNDVPLLDIRSVSGLHKHVTFTPTSGTFKLHSDMEEVATLSYFAAIGRLREAPQSYIGEANTQLIATLREVDNADEAWTRDLESIDQDGRFALPRRFQPWAKHQALRAFIKKHIGANMLWRPRDG